jgi:exodeoxyribonuclease V alpha subunit
MARFDDPAFVKERKCLGFWIPIRFDFYPIRDIQVLCPMNRGGLGARSLNIELPNALNPSGDIRIERFGWTFCPGDKVMQVENNYDKEVYDGDLGVGSRIDMEEGDLVAAFDGREIVHRFGELDELVLAHPTTIHKSQGSECPAVVEAAGVAIAGDQPQR